jgi:predicted acetyltransferase
MIGSAMLELHDYPKPHVPRDVALQIRSYVRVQWPHIEGWSGDRLWDVPPGSAARNFVLLDGEKLVSHAEANFRTIAHEGQSFNVGGLSSVFTYPAYRGTGCARRVVSAATEHLDRNGADLAMLFCGPSLRSMYASCGWEPIETARIRHGDPAAPTLHEGNLVMMRFISNKGRAARAAFEHELVYVGERTW